jgi:predicted transcriptional regulator of viral defense system
LSARWIYKHRGFQGRSSNASFEKELLYASRVASTSVARHQPTAEHYLAQVAKLVPAGVFCLLTALRFHELTTQSPAEVWTALSTKARKPRLDYPRLRVARFSGLALTGGIEKHRVEGVGMRVYSAAKTVADCFKYRKK